MDDAGAVADNLNAHILLPETEAQNGNNNNEQ
jgi:hypothetical protein